MEIKIISETENKVIPRKELNIEVDYEQAPPKRIEVRDALAEQLKKEKNLVIVKKLANVFGQRKMFGNVNVYEKDEDVKKYEPKHILKRLGVSGEGNGEKEESQGKEGEEKTKKD
ncbi:MAG: hypothetical protein J7K22_03935 [Nanoarchaeota archaeon]|nr:hypothetical protein [Nanoarchaeota archaeon]